MDAADANQALAEAGRAQTTSPSRSAPAAIPRRRENTHGFRRRAAPSLGGG